jgi:hypothetical protein
LVDAAYAIVALPLAGFVVNLVWGRRLGEPAAGWVGTAAAAGAFVAALVTWVAMLGRPAPERVADLGIFTWFPVASLHAEVGLLVDPLSLTMALFVTGVSAVIHMYSVGYMHRDPGFDRFFVYLNLFVFSMAVLVLGDNFVFSFLGWEGVGFCSGHQEQTLYCDHKTPRQLRQRLVSRLRTVRALRAREVQLARNSVGILAGLERRTSLLGHEPYDLSAAA